MYETGSNVKAFVTVSQRSTVLTTRADRIHSRKTYNTPNDSTQKIMNEFEITDWIDDILDSEDDDDGLVYEDMYYETIDTQPTGDVQ